MKHRKNKDSNLRFLSGTKLNLQLRAWTCNLQEETRKIQDEFIERSSYHKNIYYPQNLVPESYSHIISVITTGTRCTAINVRDACKIEGLPNDIIKIILKKYLAFRLVMKNVRTRVRFLHYDKIAIELIRYIISIMALKRLKTTITSGYEQDIPILP